MVETVRSAGKIPRFWNEPDFSTSYLKIAHTAFELEEGALLRKALNNVVKYQESSLFRFFLNMSRTLFGDKNTVRLIKIYSRFRGV